MTSRSVNDARPDRPRLFRAKARAEDHGGIHATAGYYSSLPPAADIAPGRTRLTAEWSSTDLSR